MKQSNRHIYFFFLFSLFLILSGCTLNPTTTTTTSQTTEATTTTTLPTSTTTTTTTTTFEVSIVFDSNGGNINGTILYHGRNFEMPADPVKEEFGFLGWYTDNETFEHPFTEDLLSTYSNGSVVNVYAKWDRVNLFHIVFVDYEDLVASFYVYESKDNYIMDLLIEAGFLGGNIVFNFYDDIELTMLHEGDHDYVYFDETVYEKTVYFHCEDDIYIHHLTNEQENMVLYYFFTYDSFIAMGNDFTRLKDEMTFDDVLFFDSQFNTIDDFNQINTREMLELTFMFVDYREVSMFVHIGDEKIVVSDLMEGSKYIYKIEHAIREYATNNQIPVEIISYFTDIEMVQPWEGYIVENMNIYVRFDTWPRYTVTLHIADEATIVIDDLLRIDNILMEATIALDDYFDVEPSEEPFVYFYTDELQTQEWDLSTSYDGMILYINYIDVERTDVRLYYDNQSYDINNVAVGNYDTRAVIFQSAFFTNIYFQSDWERKIELYTDSEFTNLWDEYVLPYQVLYIKILDNE